MPYSNCVMDFLLHDPPVISNLQINICSFLKDSDTKI